VGLASINKTENKLVKLLILGDPKVGKTAFRKRFAGNNFDKLYFPTISIDCTNITDNKNHLAISVWDTAGNTDYLSAMKRFYQNTDGLILMYDLTNFDSFKNTVKWFLNFISVGIKPSLKIAIIGNKNDLQRNMRINEFHQEKLRQYFIENFGKFYNSLDFFEISVLTKEGLATAINFLISNV